MEIRGEDNIDPLWHLADVLSLRDAIALIAGFDPNEINLCRGDTNFEQSYPRIYTVECALQNAVQVESLQAEVHYIYYDNDGYYNKSDEIDMVKTKVNVNDIRSWLVNRGVGTGFFFSKPIDAPEYLDENHANHAPKLAAAVAAWQAVNLEPDLCSGKTVKQALRIWLRKNADRFGLTKDDGNPNEQGIEEIAKVANWVSSGGAPKTPV